MKRAWVGLIFSLLLVISFAGPAAAQDPGDATAGFVPYWSYDNSPIDSVNLSTLSLMLHIPLLSYPQAGSLPPLSYFLTYDGVPGFDSEMACDDAGCWYYTVTYGGDVLFQDSPNNEVDCTDTCADVDESGAYHPLGAISSSSMITIDGTGILVDSPGSGYYYPTTPDGITFGAGGVQDKHGNTLLTYNSSNNSYTDSMGRSIPFFNPLPLGPSDQGGYYMSPACTTADFPGPPGHTSVPFEWCGSSHYIAPYEMYLYLFDSLTLPNGQSWSFGYDSSTGNLTSVTYPTGGTSTYSWNSSGYITSRTVNDGSGGKEWQYAGALSGGTCGKATVTDPDGNVTDHFWADDPTFGCFPFDAETKYYQGSDTSGTLLKTVDTTYAGGPYNWTHDMGIANLVNLPSSVIVKDGSGNTAGETTYAYD